MTPARARHRLGVILGACSRGWGRFWPPKSTELARAGPGGPSRYQWRALALAGGWFGFVPARDKRLSRKDSKPLCATFECGQKLVLRRPRLMGFRPLCAYVRTWPEAGSRYPSAKHVSALLED